MVDNEQNSIVLVDPVILEARCRDYDEGKDNQNGDDEPEMRYNIPGVAAPKRAAERQTRLVNETRKSIAFKLKREDG